MKIDADLIEDLFGGNSGYTQDGWEKVADQEGDSGRWRRHCTLVLCHVEDGTLWGIDYSRGLTENQDSDIPWRNSTWGEAQSRPGTVELYAMRAKEVTTVTYEKA